MAEPAQDQLTFLLTIGTIGVLLLSFFIILFFFSYQRRILIHQKEKQKREIEFQQQMAEWQLESQQKERIRIASDLHDSLGSLLWGAKVHTAFIERSVALQGESKESYIELMSALDQSISVVRRIAWELTPEAFHQTGLSASLSSLCDRVKGKGMTVVFLEHGSKLWHDDRAMHVFRITQELVNNCIKHSNATELTINLIWALDHLTLSIQDNGIGFDLNEKRSGVGWWSIEQRARQLKAQIDIGKTPLAQGSSIKLTVPLIHAK